jgi:hypothetical protein
VRLFRVVAPAVLLLGPGAASATAINPLPEPGVLELVTTAAVVGLVIWVRNRRK